VIRVPAAVTRPAPAELDSLEVELDEEVALELLLTDEL
jgi:hypothetical protein